jgi:hypothetical protein
MSFRREQQTDERVRRERGITHPPHWTTLTPCPRIASPDHHCTLSSGRMSPSRWNHRLSALQRYSGTRSARAQVSEDAKNWGSSAANIGQATSKE